MVETLGVESKFYVDEAVDTALREGKTFSSLIPWADRYIRHEALRSYFFERAREVLTA